MRHPMGNWLVLLPVAAATAAIVALPLALGDEGAEPPARVPVAVFGSPTENDDKNDDKVVTARQQADVDGDGQPDEVRLLEDPNDEMADGSLEVTLADGRAGHAVVPYGYPDLRRALDINRDGREQVLLMHSAGGDEAQLLVYGWHNEQLVQLQRDPDAPLGLRMHEGTRMLDYFVEDGGLFSWLRRDPADPDGERLYYVETWFWSVEGDRLVATPAGPFCFDGTTKDRPQWCGCGH